MRPVYVIAEQRSGSSWLATQLASELFRTTAYIEIDENDWVNERRLKIIKESEKRYSSLYKIYHTHLFGVLPIIETWKPTPFVIRTTRRDTLEQMLSFLLLKEVLRRSPKNSVIPRHLDPLFEGNPIYVKRTEIDAYVKTKKDRDVLWGASAVKDKQTIVYEDLFTGVSIPALGLRLSFESANKYKKTEYDKSRYFGNLDEIRQGLEDATRS